MVSEDPASRRVASDAYGAGAPPQCDLRAARPRLGPSCCRTHAGGASGDGCSPRGLQCVPLRPHPDRRSLDRPPHPHGAHPSLGPDTSGDPSFRAPARRGSVRLLLAAGRHDRPRHSPQPRRNARVDQRGGRVQAGQPREGRSAPLRTGLDDAGEAGAAGRASLAPPAPLGRRPACGSRIWLRLPERDCLLPARPAPPQPFFDVERFRSEPHRLAVVQAAARPTLVLGSTQSPDVVSDAAALAAGVAVERRRGGGGAVLLQPGDHLWLDAWIPRADPLWLMDVAVAAEWVGSWWSAALLESRCRRAARPHGQVRAGAVSVTSCASPGVVRERCSPAQRKVVGLSQWRAREGALFSSCVYTRWEPAPLAALLVGAEGGGPTDGGGGGGVSGGSGDLVDALRGVAVGVADLLPGSEGRPDGAARFAAALVRSVALAAPPGGPGSRPRRHPSLLSSPVGRHRSHSARRTLGPDEAAGPDSVAFRSVSSPLHRLDHGGGSRRAPGSGRRGRRCTGGAAAVLLLGCKWSGVVVGWWKGA